MTRKRMSCQILWCNKTPQKYLEDLTNERTFIYKKYLEDLTNERTFIYQKYLEDIAYMYGSSHESYYLITICG
jgi:hypothetical protein